MTLSASRVWRCTLSSRVGTCFASRKAAMRPCIFAHSSSNGSGVSVTRGSANPVAVFIAEAVLGSTSMRASAVASGSLLSTAGQMGGCFSTPCMASSPGVKAGGRCSLTGLIDIGSSADNCFRISATGAALHLGLATQALCSKRPVCGPPQSELRGLTT
jgi:hypothetical protein